MSEKFYFTFLLALLQLSCSSTKQKVLEQEIMVIDNTNLKLSLPQFERLSQDILDLNQFDFLFSESDKKEGLIIAINEFVKPFYNDLKLIKFNNPVRFLSHEEIYEEENEKFMDFLDGSIFIDNDVLNIIIGLRFRNTALHAKFIKMNDEWVIINKNYNNLNNYIPNYRFKKDKEQCLAEQIKFIKTDKITIPDCLKYNFE